MNPVMRERARSEGGFTLIELLVVMIIIAILMAVAVPTFLKQKQNAVRSQATSNVKQIVNAIESCAVDNITGAYNTPTVCNSKTTIQTQEKALSAASIAGRGWDFTVAGGANDYSVTVTVTGQAPFTETHATDGTITRTCTNIASGGQACPASGKW